MPFPMKPQVSNDNYRGLKDGKRLLTFTDTKHADVNMRRTSLKRHEGICDCATGVIVEMRFYMVLV